MSETVDFGKHVLMISDNGSCEATQETYRDYAHIISHIEFNGENIGTANALNKLWRYFQPYQTALCKIDNDVNWFQSGWVDQMEEVFERDPNIGICGLKRKDLAERPDHPERWARSKLRMLPHENGQRWLVVEEVNHVMGTCQAYSAALFERIGYLWQPGLYGLDDSLASFRAHLAGYKTVFLHGIEIDHIDPGGTPYTDWKQRYAGECWEEFERAKAEYKTGERDIYYDGGF